ncbi:MAG: metallophosphoesterase [Acidobacteria bacterium]|nr:metallophosphoesterase [Acidobacteriota bacterium]
MNRILLFALLLLAPPASGAGLQRKPYLQDVRTDRATVLWTMDAGAGRGELRYSLDGIRWEAQGTTVRWLPATETGLADSVYLHRADIKGLQANTTYYYRVFLDGQDVLPWAPQRELQFRTAPASGPFQFLVFGDSGDGAVEQIDVATRMFSEPSAFALHTGDLAYDTGAFRELESYYFNVYWPMMRHMAFFAIPGNHDYYSNGGYAYRTGHTPPQDGVPPDGRGLYYSFDWSNAHFAGLDTNAPFTEALAGTGKMLEWLDADLARTRQAWRIVYFHHTPFPTAAHREHEVCALVLAKIAPILERHQVHVVFAGHEHLYQRTKARRNGTFVNTRGTVYITTGGGGSRVYDAGSDDFIARSAGVSHYVRVAVNGSALEASAVSRTGELLDRFTVQSSPLVEGVSDAGGKSTLAAGSLVSIYGADLSPADTLAKALPWPLSLDGVSIKAGALDAPILFAGRGQINAQLPFGVSGDTTLEVTTPQGTAKLAIRLLPVAPSFLRLVVDGENIAAIAHLDGKPVTARTPAAAGEWLTVWMTGLGPVDPPVSAGQAAPASPLAHATVPIRVQVGGVETAMSFAGLAPGMAGIYQVNFRVPMDAVGIQQLRVFAATASAIDTFPVVE